MVFCMVADRVIDLIGDTPLIRLRRASEQTGCDIYGKAEFLNPGQSVKDRAALAMVRDAEKRGVLKPGGTVVEGTAGNTGIGLAMVARALGYRCVIVMPRTQTEEKKDAVQNCGAQLVEVDAKPYRDPDNYQHYSRRLAEDLDSQHPHGAVWMGQFDNVANRQAHYDTTGPEIWTQTDGRVDAFVCAVGSGGTIGGVGAALKERNAEVVVGLADPPGASLFNYYKHGELKAEGSSITEGIGQSRITPNLEGAVINEAYQIPDAEALEIVFRLVTEEGLSLGLSSGVNIAGAIRLAKTLGPGRTIVTVLCDYGQRYASKIFNPVFLREQGLPTPPWLDGAP